MKKPPLRGRARLLTVATATTVMATAGVAFIAARGPGNGAASVAKTISADSDLAARNAEALYVTWAGSPTERQAAEVLVAHALNGELSSCMGRGAALTRGIQRSPGSLER